MHVINEDMPDGMGEAISVMPYEDAKSIYDSNKDGNVKFRTDFMSALDEDTLGKKLGAGLQQGIIFPAQNVVESPRLLWGQTAIVASKVPSWLRAITPDFVSKAMSGAAGTALRTAGYALETEGRKVGEMNIMTANRNIEQMRERQRSEQIRLKDPNSAITKFAAIGGQYATNYAVALVAPYLSLAYMGAQSAAGTAIEGLEQYKQEHPEDKELKGYMDEKVVQELAMNIGKTVVNVAAENMFGAPAQVRRLDTMKKLAAHGFKPQKFGALRYVGKNALIGGAQEYTEEAVQGTTDTLFDYILGRYKSKDEAIMDWKNQLVDAAYAGLFGGTFGMAGAIYSRAKGIEATRNLLKDVVPAEDLNKVATVVFENNLNEVRQMATVGLEISSQLSSQKGEIYDAFRNAAFQAMKESGGYKGLTDESLWAHANEVAERFSQEAVAESFKRQVPIQEVIDSHDIVYKDGELHFAPTKESKLSDRIKKVYAAKKRAKPTSLLSFLIQNGGIKDTHGELKTFDAAKLRPGLVNNKYGLDLDRAREMAAEAGYFGGNRMDAMSNTTVADFLDLIDRELRGEKVFTPDGQKQASEIQKEIADEDTGEAEAYYERKLDEYGVDYSDMSFEEKHQAYNELTAMENEETQPTKKSWVDENGVTHYEDGTSDDGQYLYDENGNILFQEQMDLAEEMAAIDANNDAYTGDTIDIDGVQKTVYNSNGDRIAKSSEALQAFYKWFGDSKVVDEQGRPLVVYHATNADFDTFDVKMAKKGKGFWFTNNKEYAAEHGKNVMSVYLNSMNVFDSDLMETEISKYTDNPEDLLNNKEIQEKLTQDGYDSVAFNNKHGRTIIVFNPNQIKSVNNRGTWSRESDNIYYQDEQQNDKDLVVYHNISKESLEKAMKLGGLPVPSLAITRKDIPFGRFGEISLVGNKEMIDPSNYKNEVYNRDVWSATFPQTEYSKPKDSAIKKFKEKYSKYFEKTGDSSALSSFVYSLTFSPARAENEISNSLGMKLAYIEEALGEKIDIPKKNFGEDILTSNKIDKQFVEDVKDLDMNGDKEEIKKSVTKAYRKMLERKDYSEFGRFAEKVKGMMQNDENTFDKDGIMWFGKADNLLYAAKKYESSSEKDIIDDTKLRDEIDKKIKDKQAYREWSRATLEYELLGAPKIDVGRSLKEITLQNIVDAMTSGETKNAQESFVYGTGKVIAAGAKKLESIADIKLESGKFVSEEEEKAIHEKLTEDITSFSSRILKASGISFDFNAMSAAHAALGHIATLKNPTVDSLQKALNKEMGEKRVYPRYMLEDGVRIAEEVKGLVRHYFEAKPQRAVMLNEFSGAIVPTDTKYDDISQKLQEQGLKVVRSDNQLDAVKQFESEFFQVEGLGKNAPVRRGSFDANSKVIKLFENANTSTLPHELAHYWLDNMWNYANSGNANAQYVSQFNAVKNFLGVKADQENLTRAQHEKFASAYEKYLYRGVFPTPIMGTVFANYERFIRDVYQSINDIKSQGKSKVRLTPEIIQFFDSMTSGELPPVAENVQMVNEVRAEEVHQYDSKIVEEVKKEVKQPDVSPVVAEQATPQEILPVGSSGEVAESRLAKRTTEAMGIENELQYERANIEQERAKAAEMWKNDPQKAQATLQNATIGNEVLRNALYTEQQRIALENGDRDTFLKSLRKQSAEATRAGQELAALRGVVEDITMPSYWIRMAEWEAQKQLAKNMATYFDKVMGNTPLLNFTQKFDADVKALYEKVRNAQTNAEKSQIMKEGLADMKKTYRGLNQQELGELYQTDWTNEELAYDYVEKKARDAIGLNLTNEKANAIIQASRDLDTLSRKVDEFGIPTAQFFAKKSELEYLINSHTPSSQTKVLLSTLGRANMLTAPATSVLNVASNVQNYGAQKAVRMINNKLTGHTNDNLVDTNLQKQYRKRVWDTFWATGYDLSMMNSIADTRLYRGESAVNSAGEGVIRQAGQWAEKHIFGELISSPDMVFKSYLAFTDFAGNEATDIAYKEGLTGESAKARANALFTDAVKIEPTTEIGKQIRAKAQADALVITFQQDTKLARALLDMRNLVNKATGDIGVGDLLSAFVKTPANVLALGYDATVGPFGHLVNTFGAIQDARAGNLNSARVMAAIRQTTTMAVMQAIVAAFALCCIDDDDYIPDYSQLSPSERLIVKERGASFGSIRIGDTYISTDFFGPFEVPLTAWLNARRQEGFAAAASAYLGSVARKGLDAPVIKDLLDQAKAAEDVGSDSLSIWEHIYNTAGNLLISRLTPNVMNTLAKMSDDYERETNKSVLNKLIARVPFARETLAPKISVATGGPVETPSALMQLFFGSRAHKIVDNDVANELYRLYKSGERATISDITRSGDLKVLDDSEKQYAKEWFAKEYSKLAERTIRTATYKRKSDEDKKDELNKIRRDLVKQLKQKYKKKISVAKQKK